MTSRSCEHGERECTPCFRDRLSTVQVAGGATPSRRISRDSSGRPRPKKELNNHWERGTPTDHRGVPRLDEHGAVVKNKQFAEQRRRWR